MALPPRRLLVIRYTLMAQHFIPARMKHPPFPLLSLDTARNALLLGELVVFPTETVYGLGCDALNAEAVARIFLLKGRSPSMPLPLVAASFEQVAMVAYTPPKGVRELMDLFWPGPLSLLLPARRDVPDLVTAHTRRVAIRISPHPAALALCRALGRPVVATSANKSGEPPVASAADLDPDIVAGAAGLYGEGPEPSGGPPSTLAEGAESGGKAVVRLLRVGAIDAQAIRDAGFLVSENHHKTPIKK